MASSKRQIRRLSDVVDMLGRRARTLGEVYRLLGIRGCIVAGLRALPDSVLSLEWFALLENTPGPPDGERGPFEMRWGGEADLAQLVTLRPGEDLGARLAAGDRVYMALEGGRLVGYFWFRAGRWTEHAITFALAPDEVWAFDAFVPPEHRGRRIYPAISRAACHALAREGVARTLLGVDHLIGPSMSSSARGGARQIDSALVVGVLGRGFLRLSGHDGAHPRWVRFRRAAGATVSLP